MADRTERVCGVLLAGGKSRRMGGGDKSLRELGGQTLLQRVRHRAAPQVDRLVINANGDPARFEGHGLPVAPDVVDGHPGPLAGVLTGMTWAAENAPECPWVATFACDAPFFPADLVARLLAAVEREGADMARAGSGERSHPVFALWPVRVKDALRAAVEDEGIRKVEDFTDRHRLVTVPFTAEDAAVPGVDPFFNTNHPEDLKEAEALVRG